MLLTVFVVGFVVAEVSALRNADVNFAQFVNDNRICSTSTGWVRGPYSCLCLNGTLVGCLNNTYCSFDSSCLTLQACAVEDFYKCKATQLPLQGLNCSFILHCQPVRSCSPVLVRRSVCINGTLSNDQSRFFPSSPRTSRPAVLQGQNQTGPNDTNTTLTADDEIADQNATNLSGTEDTVFQSPTTRLNTATPINDDKISNATLTGTSAQDDGAIRNGNKSNDTEGPVCWFENVPALRCRHISQCYLRNRCRFVQKYVNLTTCKQNDACKDQSTCRPVWLCQKT